MHGSSNPIVRLFENSRHFLYEQGDTILRAGDTPSGVYLVATGWVKVYSLCNDGETNIITSLSSGDIFPLTWALTNSMRDVSFAALETTTLLRIPRDTFVDALFTDYEIAKAVARVQAGYTQRLEEELDNIHYRSARERVAFRLLTLVKNFGQHHANKIIINTVVPNEYIARSSNMTRETASREISWLTKQGFIDRENGHLVIKNLSGLKHEVSKDF